MPPFSQNLSYLYREGERGGEWEGRRVREGVCVCEKKRVCVCVIERERFMYIAPTAQDATYLQYHLLMM